MPVKNIFLTVVLLMPFALPSWADKELPQEINIYFIPWDVELRKIPTQDEVRAGSYVSTKISNSWYAQGFLQRLNLDGLKPIKPSDEVNIRLVIDIKFNSGTVTYISDGEFLYDSRARAAVKVDSEFRKTFDISHTGMNNIELPYKIRSISPP
jgi:hypothetical protein